MLSASIKSNNFISSKAIDGWINSPKWIFGDVFHQHLEPQNNPRAGTVLT